MQIYANIPEKIRKEDVIAVIDDKAKTTIINHIILKIYKVNL